MPYVIVYEDGQSVELRGSFESQQGNVLFSKLGLADRTKTAGKKKDLPDIKCEYFTLLERSGYQLVSSNACYDATLTGKNKIVREYIFHKFEDPNLCYASQSATGVSHSRHSTRSTEPPPSFEEPAAATSSRHMDSAASSDTDKHSSHSAGD
eukprot:scpid95378/ scgid4454/ 